MSFASFSGFAAGRSVNAPSKLWTEAFAVLWTTDSIFLDRDPRQRNHELGPVLAIHSLNIC
jgi:hypothetical protein